MRKSILYIVLSAVLFSTMEVALKLAASGVTAFQLTFLRFLIGGIALLPFAVRELSKKGEKITLRSGMSFLLLGIFLVCGSMTMFQLGLQFSSATTASVLFCTNPMFTMLFAHFIIKERLTKPKAISMAICVVGILFMVNVFNISPADTSKGILLTLGAALTFGLYTVLSKENVKRFGGITQTSFSFILGAVVLGVSMCVLKQPVLKGIGPNNMVLLFYLGAFVTGAGYLLYFKVMEIKDATTASIVFFVKPAIAPIFAVTLLNEVLHINNYVGIALILVGSFVTLRANMGKAK